MSGRSLAAPGIRPASRRDSAARGLTEASVAEGSVVTCAHDTIGVVAKPTRRAMKRNGRRGNMMITPEGKALAEPTVFPGSEA